MKPTPQTNHNLDARPSFPLTDCNYQPTSTATNVATREKRGAQRLHGFWKLSTEFHGMEAAYSDAADFLVFTLMGLACTWPFYSVSMAIVHVFYG